MFPPSTFSWKLDGSLFFPHYLFLRNCYVKKWPIYVEDDLETFFYDSDLLQIEVSSLFCMLTIWSLWFADEVASARSR